MRGKQRLPVSGLGERRHLHVPFFSVVVGVDI